MKSIIIAIPLLFLSACKEKTQQITYEINKTSTIPLEVTQENYKYLGEAVKLEQLEKIIPEEIKALKDSNVKCTFKIKVEDVGEERLNALLRIIKKYDVNYKIEKMKTEQ